MAPQSKVSSCSVDSSAKIVVSFQLAKKDWRNIGLLPILGTQRWRMSIFKFQGAIAKDSRLVQRTFCFISLVFVWLFAYCYCYCYYFIICIRFCHLQDQRSLTCNLLFQVIVEENEEPIRVNLAKDEFLKLARYDSLNQTPSVTNHDLSPFYKLTKWHKVTELYSEAEILEICSPKIKEEEKEIQTTCRTYFLKIIEILEEDSYEK